jgi:hypothetical protein
MAEALLSAGRILVAAVFLVAGIAKLSTAPAREPPCASSGRRRRLWDGSRSCCRSPRSPWRRS